MTDNNLPFNSVIQTYNRQLNVTRIKVVFPDILKRLKNQNPQRLLDYGCGAGLFLKDYSSQLGIQQVGYDIAADMLAAAHENCAHTPCTMITDNLKHYPTGSFDAITQIAVWMQWKTDEECMKNLHEIRRLLSGSGVFYVTTSHPAFHSEVFASVSTDFKKENYFDAGKPYETTLHDESSSVTFNNYHWPLSAIFTQLRHAGFNLDEMHEYRDLAPKAKGSPWILWVARPT